jgi:hypothetical protein
VVPVTWVVFGVAVWPLGARRDGGASGRWRPLDPDLGPFGPHLGWGGPTISRDGGASWGEGCVKVVFRWWQRVASLLQRVDGGFTG